MRRDKPHRVHLTVLIPDSRRDYKNKLNSVRRQNNGTVLFELMDYTNLPRKISRVTRSSQSSSPLRSVINQVRTPWLLCLNEWDTIDPVTLVRIAEVLSRGRYGHLSAIALNRRHFDGNARQLDVKNPFSRNFNVSQDVNLNRFPEALLTTKNDAILRTPEAVNTNSVIPLDSAADIDGAAFMFLYHSQFESPVVHFSADWFVHRTLDGRYENATRAMFRENEAYEEIPLSLIFASKALVEKNSMLPLYYQHHLLFWVTQYMRNNNSAASGSAALGRNAGKAFVDKLRRLLGSIDTHIILYQECFLIAREWRFVMLAMSGAWKTPEIVQVGLRKGVGGYDEFSYFYRGSPPKELFLVRGVERTPEISKVRSVRYFGIDILFERRVCLRIDGTCRLFLNGRPMPLQLKDSARLQMSIKARSAVEFPQARPIKTEKLSLFERLAFKISRFSVIKRRYAGSWVIADRVISGKDNGEVYFRYLADNIPEINVWYLVDRDSSCWKRLSVAGYKKNLISPGTLKWKLVMANCDVLAASQIGPVENRSVAREFCAADWIFVFLQHGVIHRDLSTWLNKVDIDLFVTSTPQERNSIVGDFTPYRFHEKEVVLTGLPRHDHLEQRNQEVGSKRDLVIIAPTWRNWLTASLGAHRSVNVSDDVVSSEFYQMWLRVVESEKLAALCLRNGLKLAFLPHPNIEIELDTLQNSGHIEVLRFADIDVQRVFARSRIFITDYSSMAFDAALIGRPVLYYQFDKEDVDAGGHTGLPGYFDFERDGFGEVHRNVDSLIDNIVDIVENPDRERSIYRGRRERTFVLEGNGACRRITSEVQTLLGLETA